MSEEKAPSVEDDIAETLRELSGEEETAEEVSVEEEAAVVETSEDDAEDDSEEAEETEGDEDGEEITPPEHWSPEDKDRFSKLSGEDRSWWLEKTKSLERGYQDKFQEAAELRREAEAVREALKPYERDLALAGVDRVDAVRRLVAAHDLLTNTPDDGYGYLSKTYRPSNPAGTLQALATAWGIDLGASEQADETDPAAKEIATLRAQLSDLTGKISNQEKQSELSRRSELDASIQSFSEAKDEAGNPAHPHFESLKSRMAGLLQSGAAQDLEQAYEQALWSAPDLRGEILKRQEAESAKEREAKRKEAVKKSEKASKRPRSDGAPAAASDEDLPLRELISKQVRESRA